MIKVGDFFETSFQYSQEDVQAFANVSKDTNPIHLDEKYAANTIFKKPIIHGFLGGSIFSKIIETDFPGEGTIYMKQNMTFRQPMYVDQSYKARVEVKELYAEKHRALLNTSILDENGKKVIVGEALVLNTEKL